MLTQCILIRCTFALLSQLFSVKVYLFTFLHLPNIELKLQSVEQIFYLPRSFFPHRCTQHIDAIKIAPLCSLRIKRNNFFVEFMSWMKKGAKQEITKKSEEVEEYWECQEELSFKDARKKKKKKISASLPKLSEFSCSLSLSISTFSYLFWLLKLFQKSAIS